MSFMEKRQVQMQRHEVAGEIVSHLKVFEKDLGRALSSGSALIALLPEARLRANLSGVVGTEVISDFVASLSFINEAMGKATSGHHSLDDLRRDLRIPETLGGDKIPLPSWSSELSAATPEAPDAIAG
ncbi:hypothetical protein [Sphingopyxis alaskensis]|jgi:hypothetical protein|uniref:hypothetical protein n=1 Tax=Sphingopyxis alaskensis TaxID=117207 RepID=UPI0019A15A2F|nr:hypothetical protein [Sphingopyxis alaskensis]MBD3744922.1 hypothetical protein [Sphingopyxis terrae]MCM3420222.1 hypothetical protein [Sphingopyxis alaskensis]